MTMYKSARILFYVTSGILIAGLTNCQRGTAYKRIPPLCGSTGNRRCCPGSVPTFDGLCLTSCSGHGCSNHGHSLSHIGQIDLQPLGDRAKHNLSQQASSIDSSKRPVRHHHDSSPSRQKKDFPGRNSNEMQMYASSKRRKFFRPHISQQSRPGRHHQIPKIGYRKVSRRIYPHTKRRTSSRKSSSDWKEYQKRRLQKNIRRVYDKNGKIIVLEKPTEILPNTTMAKEPRTESPKHSDKLKNMNKLSDLRREPTIDSSRTVKTMTTTITPNILSHQVDIVPQADQPLTDVEISEGDEIVLKDLVIDLPESNSTDQILKNFSQTVENLETVCRGDLCLQRQRLLNHSSSFENNRLDPSEVPCPPGYFKVYKDDTVICEVYRNSAKRKGIRERNKNRKKNKKNKKKKNKGKKTTIVSTSASFLPRTAISEITTTFSPVTTSITIKSDGCPVGQIKATRGSLVYCIEDPSLASIDIPRACPPGQKSVLRDNQEFCETEGGIEVSSTYVEKVCPRGQKAVRRNNLVYCEVEGTVEVKSTLVTPPDTDEDSNSPCPQGKVPILTSKGFICATSPGTDINTSVDSETTATACPDGVSPIFINGNLECTDGGRLDVLVPKNGRCPHGYSLASLDARSVCKRDDFVDPVNDKCPLGFILMNINNKATCQRIGSEPHIEEDFVKPDHEECPKGYKLVADSGKSTCKRSYDITDENTDLIEPINGICPQYYSLRTINGKYVCKKKDEKEIDETHLELPKNGRCDQGYSLITYHRKLVCKKDEDPNGKSADIIPPENGQCRSGYSMSTLNRRLVCVKDKGRKIPSGNGDADFVKPTKNGCPPSYILTTLNGEEICRKLTLGIDYLLPENGACPDGSALATVADRLVCKKKSKSEVDKLLTCADGQEIVKENGKATCRSRPGTTNIPEPDLNCPPGYRTYRGICEDENLIKILIESENGVRCPSGQHLVERNDMYFCEDAPTKTTTPESLITCPEGQSISLINGKMVCAVDGNGNGRELTTPRGKENISILVPSSSIASKCPPGQKPIVKEGKELCVPSRGDIDISNEIFETLTTAKPSIGWVCQAGETEVLINGHRFCQPGDTPTLLCSIGQNIMVENDKVFCEIEGDVRVEVYLPVCSGGKTPVVQNGQSTCPGTGLPPFCPHGGELIERNGNQLCEKRDNPGDREATRSPRRGTAKPENPDTKTECLPEESKTIENGKVICQRSGEINANLRTLPYGTSTNPTNEGNQCPPSLIEINENGQRICKSGTSHIIRIIGEMKGQCPEGFALVSLDNGIGECQMRITDEGTRSAVCPQGYKKILLSDGRFDCEIDNAKDCPPDYTKISLIDGNFDCQMVEIVKSIQSTPTPTDGSLYCPLGSVEVTKNGQRVCKRRTTHIIRIRGEIKGPCPKGFVKVTLRNGQNECQFEITNEDIQSIDCPTGYKKLPRSDGAFDCYIDNTRDCPPDYTKIPLIDGNFDCQIVEGATIPTSTPRSGILNCLPGSVEVTANGQTVCKGRTTHIIRLRGEIKGPCPQGFIKITLRNGKDECQLEITDEDIESIACPRGYKKLLGPNGGFDCEIDNTRDCPPAYTKIPLINGNFDCQIVEDTKAIRSTSTPRYERLNCPSGSVEVTENERKICKSDRTHIIRIPGEIEGSCPEGYLKIDLGNGRKECQMTITGDNIQSIECPQGFKKIPLPNGHIDCAIDNIEDCPSGYKKVIFGNGNFDCRIEEGCPDGYTKVSRQNGNFDCEIVKTEDCPKGYKKVIVRDGRFDCEIDNTEDCPKGYIKIAIRNGQFKCELENNDDCPNGYRKITLKNGQIDCEKDNTAECPRGYKKISLRNGQFDCEKDVTQDCPPGKRKITLRDGRVECEAIEPRVACPPGFVRKWRLNSYHCEPASSRGTNRETGSDWVDPALVECPEGYVRSRRDGLLVCEVLRGSILAGANITCGSNELLVFTDSGPKCEVFRCNEGEELITVSGVKQCRLIITTTPVPICPPDMDVVRVNSGYICRYREVTTTTIRTTTITCPQNEIKVRTDSGIRCIKIQTEKPTTTPAPCAEGLEAVRTPTGIICVYKQKKKMTTPAPSSCPQGQILMETLDGETVCGFDSFDVINCERGQVEIFTLDGHIVCKNIGDLLPEENPCPTGLELIPTDSGAECRYKESLIHETHDVFSCSPSQILTFTEFGFFCEDFVAGGQIPNCLENEVVAQVNQRLICVRKQFVSIICEEGQKMVQTSTGFFCEVSQFDSKDECHDGEILLIIGSERKCKMLEKNVDLCGEGYKAQRTEEGFVCSSLHLPLECPPGNHILSSRGQPSCYPLDDDKPCLGTDGVPCDNGVKLVPCRPGYDVIEGTKGPECELGDFVEVVCNEENQCVAESCKTGYGTRTCQDLLQLALDGCIPQCSNGGTCINKTCYCPAGVTGSSCEEDIDECSELPEGYCQYGCHNTFGNFECRCPTDSTLNEDGRTCSVIGCIPDCMNGGVCEDGICTCPRGFTGSVCENDIDECKESNGLCEFHCRNTFGSYACICPPGSRLREDQRTCLNTTCIPECKNGGTCENHQCLCTSGYYGVICQLDVNECYNDHSCSHQCINTRGSYRCGCPVGWRLGSDRKTCENLSANTDGRQTPGMLQDSWQADHPQVVSGRRQSKEARSQSSRVQGKEGVKSETHYRSHGDNGDKYQARHKSVNQFRHDITTHENPSYSSPLQRDRGTHSQFSRNQGSLRRRRPRIHQLRNIHDIARQSQDNIGRFRRPWLNSVHGDRYTRPRRHHRGFDHAARHGNQQAQRLEIASRYHQETTNFRETTTSPDFREEQLQRISRTSVEGMQIDSPILEIKSGERILKSENSNVQSAISREREGDVIQASRTELQKERILERRTENQKTRRRERQNSRRLERQNVRRNANRNTRQRERRLERKNVRRTTNRNTRQRDRQNARRLERRLDRQNARRSERRHERQNARRLKRQEVQSGNTNNVLSH